MLLLVIGGSVTDLGVGVRSAATAPFRLLQVLEVDPAKDGGRHGAYVDPSLTRQSSSVLVNRQDQNAWEPL